MSEVLQLLQDWRGCFRALVQTVNVSVQLFALFDQQAYTWQNDCVIPCLTDLTTVLSLIFFEKQRSMSTDTLSRIAMRLYRHTGPCPCTVLGLVLKPPDVMHFRYYCLYKITGVYICIITKMPYIMLSERNDQSPDFVI